MKTSKKKDDYEPIQHKIKRLVADDDYMNWERQCNGEHNPHEFESSTDRILRLLQDEQNRKYWEDDHR